MTSIFEGQPPKTRSFPIKTRVIWVPGTWMVDFHGKLVGKYTLSPMDDVAKLKLNLRHFFPMGSSTPTSSKLKGFTKFTDVFWVFDSVWDSMYVFFWNELVKYKIWLGRFWWHAFPSLPNTSLGFWVLKTSCKKKWPHEQDSYLQHLLIGWRKVKSFVQNRVSTWNQPNFPCSETRVVVTSHFCWCCCFEDVSSGFCL